MAITFLQSGEFCFIWIEIRSNSRVCRSFNGFNSISRYNNNISSSNCLLFSYKKLFYSYKYDCDIFVLSLIREILEPKLVSVNVGLNPLATLAAIFIGIQVKGIIGVIFVWVWYVCMIYLRRWIFLIIIIDSFLKIKLYSLVNKKIINLIKKEGIYVKQK